MVDVHKKLISFLVGIMIVSFIPNYKTSAHKVSHILIFIRYKFVDVAKQHRQVLLCVYSKGGCYVKYCE